MLALYRSERQADALAVFHAARRFVEELGIEPGQPLRELHEDVLRHADALGAEPALAPTGAARERRLPVAPNRTIGREGDIAAIRGRLRSGRVRLLTLTGPGGVGKTRLAVEAGRAAEQGFADGVCFVSLADLQRPEDVPATIVTALGMIVLAGESPVEALERFLAAKQLLLVVDNFEHVLSAAPVLAGVLEVCPALAVLATSREPLSLRAEERYVVKPLAVPDVGVLDDPRALAGVDSVTPVLRARASARSRLRPRGRRPRHHRRGLSTTGRATAGDRAGGCPLRIALRQRDRRSPGGSDQRARGRSPRCAGTPADIACHDRLEPQPARCPGEGLLRELRCIRRRCDDRCGRDRDARWPRHSPATGR